MQAQTWCIHIILFFHIRLIEIRWSPLTHFTNVQPSHLSSPSNILLFFWLHFAWVNDFSNSNSGSVTDMYVRRRVNYSYSNSPSSWLTSLFPNENLHPLPKSISNSPDLNPAQSCRLTSRNNDYCFSPLPVNLSLAPLSVYLCVCALSLSFSYLPSICCSMVHRTDDAEPKFQRAWNYGHQDMLVHLIFSTVGYLVRTVLSNCWMQ